MGKTSGWVVDDSPTIEQIATPASAATEFAGAGDGPRTALGHVVLSDLSELRNRIRDRLLGMTGMTEREVLAAGQGLTEMVSLARDHVDITRGALESAMISKGGGMFSAISSEMQTLSSQVQHVNSQMAELGSNLVEPIPQLSALAVRMEALTEEFSTRLHESIRQLKERERQSRLQIIHVLQTGDGVVADVLARAGESLSHLQFQDSAAQGLLEIDRWLYELEARVASTLEVDIERVPPLHITLGDSRDYDPEDAGELRFL